MPRHFSRVKDFVLVAVQRRDAGRAEHETNRHTSNKTHKNFTCPRVKKKKKKKKNKKIKK